MQSSALLGLKDMLCPQLSKLWLISIEQDKIELGWTGSEMTLQVLDQIGAAIQNATGVAVQCANFPSAWRNSSNLMDNEVFCGWSNSECLFRGGRQLFIGQDGQPDYPTARYTNLKWHALSSCVCGT